MKIIHLIPDLWNGGAEKFAIDLCSKLAETQEIVLCSFKDTEDGMIFVKDISPNVKLITLSKKKGFDLLFFIKLFKFLSEEKPDIIHTHLTAIKYCLLPLIVFKKIKAFHTIHNLPDQEEKNKFYRMVKRIFFASGRIIPISLTKSTAKVFEQVYKVRSEFIYNGVLQSKITTDYCNVQSEVNRYKTDKNTRVFLTVGSCTKRKNLELLVKTFRRLYAEKRNVILLLIGNDRSGEKNEWNKLKSLKAENTFMLGLKNNVGDYMNCSDCFCMCSLVEGMPISILEAFSNGLPVLSTPAGGIPEIVKPNINGFLSDDFSEENYYNLIEYFLQLPESTLKLIKENNKNIFKQKYSIEKAAENYMKSYRKVFKRYHRPIKSKKTA